VPAAARRACPSRPHLCAAAALAQANYCPKSGTRETAPGIVAHELGHNLGFGHSGVHNGGPYDDASSVMGAAKAGKSMTVNMAHR